ncbi:MAG: exopolysaccharide biosynthesis protein [Hyphomonadaceae bacterium]|nr:exopolysaccharide biosynthesis protein [Hyphomonadaceae bacterium]
MQDLRDAFPGEEPISVRDVLKRLEGRGFWHFALTVSLAKLHSKCARHFYCFGLLLVAPALQMIFGAGTPWLPKENRRHASPT